MKNAHIKIFVLLGVLGITILVYFIVNNDTKHYQWFENYRADSRQPFGVFFIRKMLETYRPGNDFILNEKQPLKRLLGELDDPANTDYVLIGPNLFLDDEGLMALTDFLEQGGNVFISSLVPPEDIINAVYYKECNVPLDYESVQAESVNLNFFHDSLRTQNGFGFTFRLVDEDRPYPWSYVKDSVFCDSTKSIVAIGQMDGGHVNFIKLPVGEGAVYLHSNPLVFTNYFLLKPENVNYASGVFSHLDGRHIIFDEYSKIPFLGGRSIEASPLYYIMQQPSLKYAWWLMLLTILLYVVFAARRKQRVIPVLEPKTNTSLEFVNLISQLHYKNGSHVDMARKKMKYFLYFVRSKYGIQSEHSKDEYIQRLSEKSKVNINDVQVIFSRYNLIEEKFRHSIEVNRLVDLYEAIENFYKQCK